MCSYLFICKLSLSFVSSWLRISACKYYTHSQEMNIYTHSFHLFYVSCRRPWHSIQFQCWHTQFCCLQSVVFFLLNASPGLFSKCHLHNFPSVVCFTVPISHIKCVINVGWLPVSMGASRWFNRFFSGKPLLKWNKNIRKNHQWVFTLLEESVSSEMLHCPVGADNCDMCATCGSGLDRFPAL